MADLNNSSWNETDASNNAAPPAGWPAGMFPNQVEPTAQAMMGALKRWWGRINGIFTSSGAAGVYAVTPSNTSFPTAYVDGERYTFKAHQASQGGDTLNWNALGAKPLYKPSTGGFVAIAANDIVAGQRVDVIYDSTLNGSSGGFALMGPPTASIAAPTGSVIDYAGAAAPNGWLLCYGQAISRTTYAALFTAIGTAYGAGDGSTTFNLPDLRGRVTAGVDNMGGGAAGRITAGNSGITGTTLGAAGGNEQLHSHAHGVSDPTHTHGPGGGKAYFMGVLGNSSSQFAGGTTGFIGDAMAATAAASTGLTINNAGGGASQNVQPTLMLNKIIKT
jgi:microcystin-dependent protein